jgi:hypothetical protein
VTDEDKAKKLYEIGVEFGYIDKSVSFEKLRELAADTSITISLDRIILEILALEAIDTFIPKGLENNREDLILRKFSLYKLWRSFLEFLGLAEESKPTQPMARSQETGSDKIESYSERSLHQDQRPTSGQEFQTKKETQSSPLVHTHKEPAPPSEIPPRPPNVQPSPSKGQTPGYPPATPKEPVHPSKVPSPQDTRSTSGQDSQTEEETQSSPLVTHKELTPPSEVSSPQDQPPTSRQPPPSKGETPGSPPATPKKTVHPSKVPSPQDTRSTRQFLSTEIEASPAIQAKKYLFLAVSNTQFSNKFPSVVSEPSFMLSMEETKRLYTLPLFLLPEQGDETLNRIKSVVDKSLSEGRVVLYVEPDKDNMVHFYKESPGSKKREAFQRLAGKTISVLGVVANKQLDGLGLPFFAIN